MVGSIATECVNRAARINYICEHNIVINGQNKTHVLVNLSWFLYHSKHMNVGKPVSVWYDGLFEPPGIHTLVPVQFVNCRGVSVVDLLEGESVLFFVPCIDF